MWMKFFVLVLNVKKKLEFNVPFVSGFIKNL